MKDVADRIAELRGRSPRVDGRAPLDEITAIVESLVEGDGLTELTIYGLAMDAFRLTNNVVRYPGEPEDAFKKRLIVACAVAVQAKKERVPK